MDTININDIGNDYLTFLVHAFDNIDLPFRDKKIFSYNFEKIDIDILINAKAHGKLVERYTIMDNHFKGQNPGNYGIHYYFNDLVHPHGFGCWDYHPYTLVLNTANVINSIYGGALTDMVLIDYLTLEDADYIFIVPEGDFKFRGKKLNPQTILIGKGIPKTKIKTYKRCTINPILISCQNKKWGTDTYKENVNNIEENGCHLIRTIVRNYILKRVKNHDNTNLLTVGSGNNMNIKNTTPLNNLNYNNDNIIKQYNNIKDGQDDNTLLDVINSISTRDNKLENESGIEFQDKQLNYDCFIAKLKYLFRNNENTHPHNIKIMINFAINCHFYLKVNAALNKPIILKYLDQIDRNDEIIDKLFQVNVAVFLGDEEKVAELKQTISDSDISQIKALQLKLKNLVEQSFASAQYKYYKYKNKYLKLKKLINK